MTTPPESNDIFSYYNGSRSFQWLATYFGLPVDLMNFLLCQILALFLACLFRYQLHPSKVSSSIRHAFGLVIGLCFGYFCFGAQAIHIAGLPTICYIVIRTQHPDIVQRCVVVVALFYLLCIHLHRQIYDYGSYSLDITGPLMIITQKVTSLAFSIHDGFSRSRNELSKAQQYHAVYRLPSTLEFYSYVLHFQGLMAGPMVFYTDYKDFIEGSNLLRHRACSNNLDSSNPREIIIEPSPIKAVIKKIIGSAICAFIYMKYITVYPIRTLKDPHFIEDTFILYKLWYVIMATTIVRFKYYHAWLWADAVCNNAGLGFTGYDTNGNAKWDLVSNIHVFQFEFATNMRVGINNWNIGTNRWLRFVVYERVPKKYGTLLTFGLSALWHGFYPGYYLTFATGALFVEAARSARKLFRHKFQSTQYSRIWYDILTFIATRISMGYITFPFVLLEFWASVQMYLNFYMCLHLVAGVIIYLFYKTEKNTTRSQSQNVASLVRNISDQNNINENNVNDNNDNNVNNDNNAQKGNLNRLISNHCLRRVRGSHNLQNERSRLLEEKCIAESRNLLPRSKNQGTSTSEETHSLSNKLKEKIVAEKRNIGVFIDKTVTEISEFRNDLMCSRGHYNLLTASPSTFIPPPTSTDTSNVSTSREIFMSGETPSSQQLPAATSSIVDAISSSSVLPAVLSNSHGE